MRMIDAHCHFDFPRFDGQRAQVLVFWVSLSPGFAGRTGQGSGRLPALTRACGTAWGFIPGLCRSTGKRIFRSWRISYRSGPNTITEKVLLFGQALQKAGTVKGKKSGQHAKSDWMEMEKERGISVTTSVMQFPYGGKLVNLLDTPGHEDFENPVL